MADSLLIGLSALQAHQRSMEVTSHNIANMATPGFSRQKVALGAPVPENATPGQLGRGVDVQAIARLTDELLTSQIQKSSSEEGRLKQLALTLSAMEGIFSEPGGSGLSAAISQMFSTLQDLANNPESVGMRRAAVEEMVSFTTTLNGMANSLQDLKDGVQDQFELTIDQINGLTQRVSNLNRSIRDATAAGNNANDLLDERERLLQELSTLIDVRVRVDGQSNVAFVEASGRLLIDATSAATLEPGSSQGGLALRFGDSGETITLSGGKIGALIELHDVALPSVITQLDDLALTVASAMNALHATGVAADFPQSYFLSENVIRGGNTALNLDDAAQVLGAGGQGILADFLPRFSDDAGNPVAGNLTINIVNATTGVAEKHVVRYEPGLGPVAASRSLQDLVDAINTGTGGGFSVHGPNGVGVGISNLSASMVSANGGVRLLLEASGGHTLDFSRALDTQPSAELRNAATWTVGAPVVDLGGRYTGTLGFAPTQPWTMEVLSSGIVGDTTTPPSVRFTWIEDVDGSPVNRTTDLSLGQGYQPGQAITIGDGVHVTIGTGTLIAGDRLDLVVDGRPDEMGLLAGLGLNTLFTGSNARSLAVASQIREDPARLAVSQSRAAGDNSNVLAILEVRGQRIFNQGTASLDDYWASTMAGVGSEKDLVDRLNENQVVVRQTLENRRDQISGVNLDEEVGLLILQQQAYSAAARIITTAQENIRTLLDILR